MLAWPWRAWPTARSACALHLIERTVKTDVGRFLEELGLQDRVQAIIWHTKPAWCAPATRVADLA